MLTNNVIIFIIAKILYASIGSPGFLNLISYSASTDFLLHILMLRNFLYFASFPHSCLAGKLTLSWSDWGNLTDLTDASHCWKWSKIQVFLFIQQFIPRIIVLLFSVIQKIQKILKFHLYSFFFTILQNYLIPRKSNNLYATYLLLKNLFFFSHKTVSSLTCLDDLCGHV